MSNWTNCKIKTIYNVIFINCTSLFPGLWRETGEELPFKDGCVGPRDLFRIVSFWTASCDLLETAVKERTSERQLLSANLLRNASKGKSLTWKSWAWWYWWSCFARHRGNVHDHLIFLHGKTKWMKASPQKSLHSRAQSIG